MASIRWCRPSKYGIEGTRKFVSRVRASIIITSTSQFKKYTHHQDLYWVIHIFFRCSLVLLMFCSRPVRGSLGAAVGRRLFGLIQIFEQSGRLRGDHFRTRCRTKFSSFGQAHSQIVRTCRCLIRVLSRSAGRSSLGFGQSFGKLLRDLRANTNQLTLQGACDAACHKKRSNLHGSKLAKVDVC